MPGLNDLQKTTQPSTGPASLVAVVAALSPQEHAMVQAGIDPYGEGVPAGTPGTPVGLQQQASSGLTPEARLAIGQILQESLAALGQPADESTAVAAQSIQNAIMALGGGR